MLSKADARVATGLGLLGGVSLSTFHAFITPGKNILIPYAVLLLATITVTHWQSISTFRRRFLIAFSSLSFSLLLFYAFVALTVPAESSAFAHLGRIALLTTGTAGIAALAAMFTKTPFEPSKVVSTPPH